MKNYILIIIASLLGFTMFSCKSDTASKTISPTASEFAQAEKNYLDNPSPMSGTALISQISTSLGKPDLLKADRLSLLEKGLKICNDQNIIARKGNFLYPLIKEDYLGSKTADRIYELADLMGQMKKNSAADILYSGLAKNFPQYSNLDAAKSKISENMSGTLEEYIGYLGEKIFDDPDDIGVNRKASLAYVDACEAYGLVNPKNAQTPEFLFKAAEVAKSIRTFPKSLSLYDWIIDKYPGYEKTPTSMFLKGFILENNIKDDQLALKVYQEFIAKYPEHNLADDAQFLIENIGKSDEEILQMIENKRKDAPNN